MAARIDRSALWGIAPGAHTPYREAFVAADEVLLRFGMTSAVRVAHFLAQVLHETAGLTLMVENLNYTAPRLMRVWPSRFRTMEAAGPFAGNPRALANKVYGGRMGNVEPDDGWRFRGRGMLQITGRENYQEVGDALGIDLVLQPERVLEPDYSLAVAACIWKMRGCNAVADRDDVRAVTRIINGGAIGIASRTEWLRKTRQVVSDDE